MQFADKIAFWRCHSLSGGATRTIEQIIFAQIAGTAKQRYPQLFFMIFILFQTTGKKVEIRMCA
ncbi:hypothetical protein ACFSKS_00905 [Pseudocitrobacter faecalis]